MKLCKVLALVLMLVVNLIACGTDNTGYDLPTESLWNETLNFNSEDEALDMIDEANSDDLPIILHVGKVPKEIKELLWEDENELIQSILALTPNTSHAYNSLYIYMGRLRLLKDQEYYYMKYLDAEGIAILASKDIPDEDLHTAREIVI